MTGITEFWKERFEDGWTEEKTPIPVIEVRAPFYEHECDCGFIGSSEVFSEVRNHDDASMICPRCLKDN